MKSAFADNAWIAVRDALASGKPVVALLPCGATEAPMKLVWTRRSLSHSTSAGGVSGGVGFGGTRQPSPLLASSSMRSRATSFRSRSDWPSPGTKASI